MDISVTEFKSRYQNLGSVTIIGEIIVICQRGLRSETTKQVLTQYGYTNVRNLTGGLMPGEKLMCKQNLYL